MTGRFIGKTFVEHRREFIENCQYGKQLEDLLELKNMQKRPQAPKPIFLGLESEKSEIQIRFLRFLKIDEMCSRNFCAEWIIHFSKRAHEVPNLSKTDSEHNSETL